jgi:hypothetical protein
MPFDCTPVLDLPKQSPSLAGEAVEIAVEIRTSKPIPVRPVSPWYVSRRPEQVEATAAVLVRARGLITDERRWCKRAFARAWLDIPVPVQSVFARRFCATGAIKRASRELGLSAKDANNALEWQTVRPIPDWNDDPLRTHGEVVAAFDAAIVALA